jgi:predicted phage tail protein
VGTVRDALQLSDMRRIELGYGLSITGELAGTVALVVYALSAGGAALVAAYAASRTVAGMGVALVLTGLTNRLRRPAGCKRGAATPGQPPSAMGAD